MSRLLFRFFHYVSVICGSATDQSSQAATGRASPSLFLKPRLFPTASILCASVEHGRWDTLVGAGGAPSSCPGLKAKLLPFYDHISAWNVCCLCDETSQDMCTGDVHRPVLSGLPLGSLKIRPGAPLSWPVPAQWCLHFHPHCVCDRPLLRSLHLLSYFLITPPLCDRHHDDHYFANEVIFPKSRSHS